MNLMSKYRLEKRAQASILTEFVAFAGAMGAALIVSAGLIAISGADVTDVFAAIYRGAFGDARVFLETLVQATPLMLTGLAIVIAFMGRIWNIGAEGQFFAGAMTAAWISMNLSDLPRPLLVPLILIGAMAGGAFWGFIPGFLRARFGTNEIIVTVMMNFIVLLFLSYLLTTTWTAPEDFYLQTPRFVESTHLPTFFNSRLHLGFFIALLLAGLVYLFLWRTPLGYEIRAMGENPTAARYKGIKINQTIILVMIISGAIAGLAGGTELNGLHHRLRLEISPGYGFTAILVALLGRLNPFGVILAAIFFGALVNGSTGMQIFTGVPVALVDSVQAIVLVCLLIAQVIARFRIRRIIDAG